MSEGRRLYFEDFEPGATFDLGSKTVLEDEILRFAREFDPQPFHTDAEAAKASIFGGLVASGMHIGSIWMRLYFDAILSHSASMGSPGIQDMRWHRPLRPGDTVHGQLHIVAANPSTRDPLRGSVMLTSELRNQQDETVMTLKAIGLFGRLP